MFLTYYPNITHIVLCLDNDEAGRTRTQDIIKHLDGSGKTVKIASRLSARTITTRWCRSRRNTKSTVSAWMIFWRRKPDENYCYRKSERRHRQNDYRVQLRHCPYPAGLPRPHGGL
ncbi:toprim domain-containing protein [Gemmiger formicilis]|uniref:toprim domain-containing protein n=1 Tax=Gemmiger formicilis TaxID=745368 RepID=UPI003CCB41FE